MNEHQSLSTEERLDAVRQATRGITGKCDRRYWRSCVDERRPPTELLKAMGNSGLLGLGVPEDRGGQGGGLIDQVVLIEELGRAGIPSYSFLVANFVRSALLRHGAEEQIGRHVPPTLDGEHFTAFALTEADAGTNTFAMRTRATRDGDGWLINGQKCFITAAGEASQMMAIARTSPHDPTRRAHGLSAFIFDLPAEGVSWTAMDMTVAAPDVQYVVYFDDLWVPFDAVVGAVDEGAKLLFEALNPERVFGAAQSVGMGSFALAKGVAYARTRAPFGRPVGSYQAVQHPFAKAHIELEAARMMMYEGARLLDVGKDGAFLANASKYLASEAANAALDAAIQVHGGSAFDREQDLITLYENLRLFRIAPIHNDMVLNFVAERELALPRSS